MNNIRMLQIFIVLVAIMVPVFVLGGYYLVLYVTWDGDKNFMQAHSCLQEGGVWQKDIARCWYAGVCEDEGGYWFPKESRCVFER